MSGRGASTALVLLLLLAAVPLAAGGPEASFTIDVSDWRPAQGEPVFVTVVPSPPADDVTLVWKGLSVPTRNEGPGRFRGVVGVDLLDPPGTARLEILAERGGERRRIALDLDVVEKTFPTQALRLPREMAEFDAATLARIEDEGNRMERILSRVSSVPVWDLPFVPPVDPFVAGRFGARRMINGEPRAPHAGVDVKAPEGAPVVAAAAGTVVFAGEQFFGGKSVVIDHGGGLFTVYFHLRDMAVSEGAGVARGERIGSVGATGRAEGPHLHFGVRAAGGRVDPAPFFGPTIR
ncbi:MAG: M23 family metallopeptidase [Deltaproteobacteria bacterium]|nr:M23 family metallopeptidase [Deltaproteobacteria bacterium]